LEKGLTQPRCPRSSATLHLAAGWRDRYTVRMYRLAPGIKQNPEKRWALPDRVFFACGACHILAYAFLQHFPDRGFRALWIKPAPGFTGNHIVVTSDDGAAFDYHGFSRCICTRRPTAGGRAGIRR
jgi:hypothetical protein